MFCAQCGKQLNDSTRFCNYCGAPQNTQWQSNSPASNTQNPMSGPPSFTNQQWQPNPAFTPIQVQGLIGFSPKIQDPAFTKYSKASSRYSMIFGTILALAAIIGFPIYGNASGEVDFPQSLYYGLIIGGMFFLIAVVQTLRKGSDTTWDGVVIDKKTARRTYSDNDDNSSTIRHYIEYKIVIQRENGEKYTHTFRDQPTIYHYYDQGGRVRHHKGMTYYEKYDKSRDQEILCAACLTMNDIRENACTRCKCPLLKN